MQWIIGFILVVGIIVLAVYSLVKDKKSGRTSCGCGCSNCAMNGECHSKKIKS